jgi:hypothetical protein
MNRHTFSPILGLIVIFGLLLLVGCQASAEDPAPTDMEQLSPTVETTPTTPPTSPTVEEVQDEAEPATMATATAGSQDGAAGDGQEATGDDGGKANADVEFVRATLAADGTWRFEVTVRHPDTGWDDYADGWDVLTPDGQVLKIDETDRFTRLLLHPHESEQPFTRSQSGVMVPDGVTEVIVRAHDLVDGFGGREVRVDLTAGAGADYEVIR